jgi:hypothetical protein
VGVLGLLPDSRLFVHTCSGPETLRQAGEKRRSLWFPVPYQSLNSLKESEIGYPSRLSPGGMGEVDSVALPAPLGLVAKKVRGETVGRSRIRSEAQSPVKARPRLVDLHVSFEGGIEIV